MSKKNKNQNVKDLVQEPNQGIPDVEGPNQEIPGVEETPVDAPAMDESQEEQLTEVNEGIDTPSASTDNPLPGQGTEEAQEPGEIDNPELKANKNLEPLNGQGTGEAQEPGEILEETQESNDDYEIESEEEFLAVVFTMMTGHEKLPGKINVVKLVKDTWTIKKPGKHFPGFLTAKNILAKEYAKYLKKD